MTTSNRGSRLARENLRSCLSALRVLLFIKSLYSSATCEKNVHLSAKITHAYLVVLTMFRDGSCFFLLRPFVLFFSRFCSDTASYEVESPLITWVRTDTGIVFVVLGKRILGGKPGVFPERRERGLSLRRARKEYIK